MILSLFCTHYFPIITLLDAVENETLLWYRIKLELEQQFEHTRVVCSVTHHV